MDLSRVVRSRWLFVVSLVVVLCVVVAGVRGWGSGEHEVAPAEEQPAVSSVTAAMVPTGVVEETSDQPMVSSICEQPDLPAVKAEAAADDEASVLAPDKPGPYHVGYYGVKYVVEPWGTYYAMVRYPATRDGYRAPKNTAAAPYPGIVIGPSYATLNWWSTWNANHLVSHGYVTISFTMPYPLWPDPAESGAGYDGGIDQLKAENSRAGSPIAGLVDVQTIGITGLSMGGAGCILAAGTNPEVDCAVALAPGGIDMDLRGDLEKAAKNIKIPIQLQVGTNDAILALMPHGVGYYYSPLIPDTTPKEYVEIKGANHVGFVDAFYAKVAMALLLDKQCTIGIEEQHRISEKYFISWFNYFLKGQTGYGIYIFGSEAQKDVSSGVLSQLQTNVS